MDHLTQSFEHTDVGIAYIYCNYKEKSGQSTVNLISSLLQQLVESRSAIPDEIKRLYRHHQKKGTRLAIDECSQLLRSEVRRFSTVYFIIDALDECLEERRQILLDELRKLRDYVKLLVTSRHIPTIERYFEPEKHLEIRASDEDIQNYLRFRIANSTRLERHVTKYPNLLEEIIAKIVEKAHGM